VDGEAAPAVPVSFHLPAGVQVSPDSVFRGKKGPEIVPLLQDVYCGDQIPGKPGGAGDESQPFTGKAEIFFTKAVNTVLHIAEILMSHNK
jgi:hypothetical protein